MTTSSKIYQILLPDERRRAASVFFYMLGGMLLEMLSIGLIIPIMTIMRGDANIKNSRLDALFGHLDQKDVVMLSMCVLISIYLVKNLFLAFLAFKQSQFAYGIQEELSQRLFLSYMRQPYPFHLERNSAQLIRNITSEVSFFSSHALIPGMLLVAESLVIFGVGGLLLYMEPVGAILVLVFIGGSAWSFQRITRRYISHWGEIRQQHEGLCLQHLQQGLGGVKDVKLLGRESYFLSQYATHNRLGTLAAQNQSTLQQLPRITLEFLAVMGLAVLVMSMVMLGRDIAMFLPSLGFFAMAALRLMPSVNRILTSVQTLRFMSPTISMLHSELEHPNILSLSGKAAPVSFFSNAIALVGVSFSYQTNTTHILEDITLTINRGETVGFVGSSGAGKSTLVDIMLGLLSPSRGQILVDEIDIHDALRTWQNQIGYVPQSIYLTDDTLRCNIAFGLPEALIDEAAVARAIRAAQLEEFIGSLPEGLDTMVGERGIRLSGGQRQRIGIARALYHDPAILVLDEATSALDQETEKEVMAAINVLHGQKTIVIIAHRLSTVEKCDRLYRIERGKVVAQGSVGTIIQDIKTSPLV